MDNVIKKIYSYAKNNPKKSIFFFIIILIILYYLFSNKQKVEYITAPVTRNNIGEAVLATGRIDPERTINVGAQVSGEIQKVFVELGQFVKEGDLIAIIDPRTQQNDLKTAEADLKQSEAAVESRQANLVKVQQEYNRQKIMFQNNATSKQLYLDSISNLNIVKSELKQIKETIVRSKNNLETAKLNLSYTTIKAPSDGSIISLPVEEGQTLNVNFNSQTIAVLANLNKLTIKSEISEADINKIKIGQNVEFSIIGDNSIVYNTKVKSIDPAPTYISNPTNAVSNDAIYYFITMNAPNPYNNLHTGMNVNVKILQSKIKNAITIPNSALNIIDNNTQNEVLVYNVKNNKYEHRKVELGISDGVETEVKNGLNENDIIVIQKVIKSNKKNKLIN